MPAERAKLLFNQPQIADGGHCRVRLELVVIDDDDDFAETLVGGRLQRLPDLAFLQFAVTGHHDDSPGAPEEPVRARHAVRFRDAHAKRAGVGGDERRRDIGVARQSTKPAQLMNQGNRAFRGR
jgi:hypothetical protein